MSNTAKFLFWATIIGVTIYLIIRSRNNATMRRMNGGTAGKISNAPRNNPNSITQADANASFNCDLCTSANMDPSSEIATYNPATGKFHMPNGREAIKCCTSRDSSCHCLTWVWKASSDCTTVSCGGSVATQPSTPQIYFDPHTNSFYQSLMNVSGHISSTPTAGAGSSGAVVGAGAVAGK